MDWKSFFLKQLRTILIIVGISALLFGLFGFFTAGKIAFKNSLILGAILGMVAAVMYLGVIVSAHFWSGYSNRYGEWWIKKETEGDPKDKKHDKKH